ncbi:hypothetical protein HDU67_003296 [Dinochytrium kinnereticum]|nr:hypothetical protein HDU67_003296 [Dinochytrium kinnereticum]
MSQTGSLQPLLTGDYMGSDRMLAEALSVLCQGLYGLLERAEFSRSHSVSPASLQALDAEMREKIESVRRKRPDSQVILSEEHMRLWQEIDRLVALIESLMSSGSPGGKAALPPPTYKEAMAGVKVANQDFNSLHDVVNAIDRILSAAPRMVNQTAAVSDRQKQRLAAASMVALIERLLAGREEFEAQRAVATQPSRHAVLNDLIDRIVTAGGRTYSDQRVELSAYQRDLMDLIRLIRVIEQQKGRYANQDYESREMILQRDLAALEKEINAYEKTQMLDQRFIVSDAKQRDMFMKNMVARICRMEDRRFENQDAVAVKDLREDSIEELMMRLNKAQRMDDQRAFLLR